jgi:hypothetical protein
MRAITAPTATVSPSLTSVSAITPATGDGTSTLTLSVSRLAIGSSAATASPGFFSHCASVPSVIDSPSAGTERRLPCCSFSRAAPRRRAAPCPPAFVEGWPSAAAISAACSAAWRLASPVAGEAPRRGRHIAAAARNAGFRQARFEQRLDEEPGAVVLRLFLRPDHLLQLRHRLQPLDQRLGRERVELLDAQDLDAEIAGWSRASISS